MCSSAKTWGIDSTEHAMKRTKKKKEAPSPYKNCLDYLDAWGQVSFSQVPFCPIDSLILSICCYTAFDGILSGPNSDRALTFRQAVAQYTQQPGWDHTGVLISDHNPELLVQAANSPRFSRVRLGCYESILDETSEIQFAALTWFLPDGTLYVSFRGTDDTLVGWKECFRMAFTSPIPSQKLAEDYLARVTARHPGKLRLGGHSKGGNLAIWAAVHAAPVVRRRILRVESHDGPGFPEDLTETPAYRSLTGRIHVYVPQSSLVGALLHQDEARQIIFSHGPGTLGQHDPFTWEVDGTQFRLLPARSSLGQRSSRAVHTWLASMEPQELEDFVEVIFHLLGSGHARTVSDIPFALIDNAWSMTRSFKALDSSTRRKIRSYLRRMLAAVGAANLPRLPGRIPKQ